MFGGINIAHIIIEFGSANTCKNNKKIVKEMYDELKRIDTNKHQITCKWQIFKNAGQNIPLDKGIFDYAYNYGRELGYPVTASVFDLDSLRFLLQYEVPFIKIANNRKLDYLVGETLRNTHIYISCGSIEELKFVKLFENITPLLCVSNYPSTVESYEKTYGTYLSNYGISDHTTTFDLWNNYQPEIIEWHYKLPNSTGLDAGHFARTPEQLQEVL